MAATPPDDLYCVAEVDLFRDLSRTEMGELNARAPLQAVGAGQIVCDPLRPVDVLFIVKRGRLRVFRVMADGRTSPPRSSDPTLSSARCRPSAYGCVMPGPKPSNPASYA